MPPPPPSATTTTTTNNTNVKHAFFGASTNNNSNNDRTNNEMSNNNSNMNNTNKSLLGWSCRRCTYHHHSSGPRCVMCGEMRVATREEMRDFIQGKKVPFQQIDGNVVELLESDDNGGVDGGGPGKDGKGDNRNNNINNNNINNEFDEFDDGVTDQDWASLDTNIKSSYIQPHQQTTTHQTQADTHAATISTSTFTNQFDDGISVGSNQASGIRNPYLQKQQQSNTASSINGTEKSRAALHPAPPGRQSPTTQPTNTSTTTARSTTTTTQLQTSNIHNQINNFSTPSRPNQNITSQRNNHDNNNIDTRASDSSSAVKFHPLFLRNGTGRSTLSTGYVPGPVSLCTETSSTWIYPQHDKFPTRQYQLEITETALQYNTLVSLPTGLGKTLIAAVVLYNYYRWFPTGKVLFMAPTLPLVHQQVQACYQIMGLPAHDTALLTGKLPPAQRLEHWKERRAFYCTPQTVQKDFASHPDIPREVVCVVLDEAHKATGDYAYVKVIEQLEEAGAHYRIVGLSATPGTTIKAVQKVVQALRTVKIEARYDSDPSVIPYLHQKHSEIVIVPKNESQREVERLLSNLLIPILDRLRSQGAMSSFKYTGNATLTPYQVVLAKEEYFKRQQPNNNNGGGVNTYRYRPPNGAMHTYFQAAYKLVELRSDAHQSLGIVKTKMLRLKSTPQRGVLCTIVKSKEFDHVLQKVLQATSDGSKQQHVNNSSTQILSQQVVTLNNPKLKKLSELLQEHFQRAEACDASSRAIVFSQFRDSVAEICNVLEAWQPLIKPRYFIGQGKATSTAARKNNNLNKNGDSAAAGGAVSAGCEDNRLVGMKQSEQHHVIRMFREGTYNVLVCTCIGEEGLDIGDVDLIVNYDTLRSPIRMIQRTGRTGRRRDGRVVCLLSEGLEEKTYHASKQAEQTLMRALKDKSRFLMAPHKPLFPNTVVSATTTMTSPSNVATPPPKQTCVMKRIELAADTINWSEVAGGVGSGKKRKQKKKKRKRNDDEDDEDDDDDDDDENDCDDGNNDGTRKRQARKGVSASTVPTNKWKLTRTQELERHALLGYAGVGLYSNNNNSNNGNANGWHNLRRHFLRGQSANHYCVCGKYKKRYSSSNEKEKQQERQQQKRRQERQRQRFPLQRMGRARRLLQTWNQRISHDLGVECCFCGTSSATTTTPAAATNGMKFSGKTGGGSTTGTTGPMLTGKQKKQSGLHEWFPYLHISYYDDRPLPNPVQQPFAAVTTLEETELITRNRTATKKNQQRQQQQQQARATMAATATTTTNTTNSTTTTTTTTTTTASAVQRNSNSNNNNTSINDLHHQQTNNLHGTGTDLQNESTTRVEEAAESTETSAATAQKSDHSVQRNRTITITNDDTNLFGQATHVRNTGADEDITERASVERPNTRPTPTPHLQPPMINPYVNVTTTSTTTTATTTTASTGPMAAATTQHGEGFGASSSSLPQLPPIEAESHKQNPTVAGISEMIRFRLPTPPPTSSSSSSSSGGDDDEEDDGDSLNRVRTEEGNTETRKKERALPRLSTQQLPSECTVLRDLQMPQQVAQKTSSTTSTVVGSVAEVVTKQQTSIGCEVPSILADDQHQHDGVAVDQTQHSGKNTNMVLTSDTVFRLPTQDSSSSSEDGRDDDDGGGDGDRRGDNDDGKEKLHKPNKTKTVAGNAAKRNESRIPAFVCQPSKRSAPQNNDLTDDDDNDGEEEDVRLISLKVPAKKRVTKKGKKGTQNRQRDLPAKSRAGNLSNKQNVKPPPPPLCPELDSDSDGDIPLITLKSRKIISPKGKKVTKKDDKMKTPEQQGAAPTRHDTDISQQSNGKINSKQQSKSFSPKSKARTSAANLSDAPVQKTGAISRSKRKIIFSDDENEINDKEEKTSPVSVCLLDTPSPPTKQNDTKKNALTVSSPFTERPPDDGAETGKSKPDVGSDKATAPATDTAIGTDSTSRKHETTEELIVVDDTPETPVLPVAKKRKTKRWIVLDGSDESSVDSASANGIDKDGVVNKDTSKSRRNVDVKAAKKQRGTHPSDIAPESSGTFSSLSPQRSPLRNMSVQEQGSNDLVDTPVMKRKSDLVDITDLTDTPTGSKKASTQGTNSQSAIRGSTDVQDIVCAVCHSGDSLDDDPIVLCDGTCNLAFHQSCYGTKVDIESNMPWFCDFCDKKGPRHDAENNNLTPSCRHCLRPNLPLRYSPSTGWCHPVCAPAPRQQPSASNKCVVCKKIGAVKCLHCSSAAHPHCVITGSDVAGSWSIARVESPERGGPIIASGLFCPKHGDHANEFLSAYFDTSSSLPPRIRVIQTMAASKSLPAERAVKRLRKIGPAAKEAKATSSLRPKKSDGKAKSTSQSAADTKKARQERRRQVMSRFALEEAHIAGDEDLAGDADEYEEIQRIEAEEEAGLSHDSFINDSTELTQHFSQDSLSRIDPDAKDEASAELDQHRSLDARRERDNQFSTPLFNRRMRQRGGDESWQPESRATSSSQKGLGNMHFIRSVLDHCRQGGRAEEIETFYRQVARSEGAEFTPSPHASDRPPRTGTSSSGSPSVDIDTSSLSARSLGGSFQAAVGPAATSNTTAERRNGPTQLRTERSTPTAAAASSAASSASSHLTDEQRQRIEHNRLEAKRRREKLQSSKS